MRLCCCTRSSGHASLRTTDRNWAEPLAFDLQINSQLLVSVCLCVCVYVRHSLDILVWTILPFWQLWTQFGLSPRRVAWRSLRAKCMEVSVGLPVDRIWNSGSDLQAGVEIYHWGYPGFWLILSSQIDPLLGPQFQPPVWSNEGPISLCPQGGRTQFQVVHSDIDPRSCLLSCEPLALPWPGEPSVRMTPILVILAS